MKRVVVVSRRLVEGSPINVNINVLPDDEGVPTIALAIALSDFLAALADGIGNPALILTRAQLAAKLASAAETVIENIKGESVRVM